MRPISRAIALAVVREAIVTGLAPEQSDLAEAVDAAMWWPGYVPHPPA